jgi:hypothetical protein
MVHVTKIFDQSNGGILHLCPRCKREMIDQQEIERQLCKACHIDDMCKKTTTRIETMAEKAKRWKQMRDQKLIKGMEGKV